MPPRFLPELVLCVCVCVFPCSQADAVNGAFAKALGGQLEDEGALRALVEPCGPSELLSLGHAASASILGGTASVAGGTASVARGSQIGFGRASQLGLTRQGSQVGGRRAEQSIELPPEPRPVGPPNALNPVCALLWGVCVGQGNQVFGA
jgi:hypothetical protein